MSLTYPSPVDGDLNALMNNIFFNFQNGTQRKQTLGKDVLIDMTTYTPGCDKRSDFKIAFSFTWCAIHMNPAMNPDILITAPEW